MGDAPDREPDYLDPSQISEEDRPLFFCLAAAEARDPGAIFRLADARSPPDDGDCRCRASADGVCRDSADGLCPFARLGQRMAALTPVERTAMIVGAVLGIANGSAVLRADR